MQRHLVNVITPPPKAATLHEENMGHSGRDRRVAQDPQLVEWLTKVLVEQINGSRDWPEFNSQQLARFLGKCGVDVRAAMDRNEDALLSMPRELVDAEKTVPRLQGASFLASSAEHVCFQLRKRHNVASRA